MSIEVKNTFLNLFKLNHEVGDNEIHSFINNIKDTNYSSSFNNSTMENILFNFFKGYVSVQRLRIKEKEISLYDVINLHEYSLKNIEFLSKKETLDLTTKTLHDYLFLIGFYENPSKENILHQMISDFFDLKLS